MKLWIILIDEKKINKEEIEEIDPFISNRQRTFI